MVQIILFHDGNIQVLQDNVTHAQQSSSGNKCKQWSCKTCKYSSSYFILPVWKSQESERQGTSLMAQNNQHRSIGTPAQWGSQSELLTCLQVLQIQWHRTESCWQKQPSHCFILTLLKILLHTTFARIAVWKRILTIFTNHYFNTMIINGYTLA